MADDREKSRRDPKQPPGDDRSQQRPPSTARLTPFTQQVGRVALVLVAGLFVAFASINLQPVDFHWILGGTEVVRQGGEYVRGGVPLIVLMLGSFAVGALVGAGLVWWRRRHRKPPGDPARADPR